MDLTDFVRNSGVEQNPLCRGGLPGIDVRHDADIPRFIECDLPGHCLTSRQLSAISLQQLVSFSLKAED
jgi:hypothetical protein